MDSHNNRVVVTGIGILSPIGLDVSTTWEGIIAGKSGIDYITLFDSESFDTKIAGEVKGFEPTDYINRKDARRMDRFAQLAVAASRQAVEQARLQPELSNGYDVGVIVGSGIGGIITLSEQVKVLLEKGPGSVNPFLIPMMIADMAPAQISISLGVKGPNFCTTSSCSSSSDAIGTAYEVIKRGDAQAMITGGSEAIVTPIGIAGFNACRALSTRNSEPQAASRPFDAERDGFVVGEGAAILILENLAFAQKRGANILAEMTGYGASSDAYHITQPSEDGSGAIKAIKITLSKAGLTPNDVDYINAHGTSTPLNDKVETMAIKAVFGDRAYHMPISSTKSMTGHLIGGAGAIEAAICLMAIQNGIIPPTINLTHPDPECDLDYVANAARSANITTAMSNSFGFGGHNSVLIFRKYSEAQT
ncbi:3-oxoacyl-[acyl-carrier-protein] synthase 2 [subsurface metagenome]